MTTTTCKVNKRDAKTIRNANGDCNLVARYRRTRKGRKINVGHGDWGVEGRNGSDYYEIRIGSDGLLYCSCTDYRFRGHKSNRNNPGTNYMCKHIRAYLVHSARMIASGVSMDSEAIIYNAQVTEAAIDRMGAAAQSGHQVADCKAA